MLDEKLIEDLKAKNPGKQLSDIVVEFDDNELHFVVSAPGKPQILKYLQEVSEAGREFQAAENFVLACTVWPERKDLQALFDKQPLIITTLNKQLEKQAGFGAKAQVKKL